ncbi:hypothetical protein WH47_07600, partial [Habropoda laboriosa]
FKFPILRLRKYVGRTISIDVQPALGDQILAVIKPIYEESSLGKLSKRCLEAET